MRKLTVSSLVLLAAAAFFASVGFASNKAGCVQMLTGIICPPPNGGVSSGLDGQVVCGPGECARNSKGVVKCSSVSGGGAILDINGEVLCVGGCIDGQLNYCVVPQK